MRRWFALLLAVAAGNAVAQAPEPPGHRQYTIDFEEDAPWQEQQDVPLPAFPRPENLLEFYVSAVSNNKYLIDASTLAIGNDGVVRYVLVVRTSGGAVNISFEGINCKERSWKHYATGHGSSTWVRSRASRIGWRPIENKPVNRHHAALSRDLFCPNGIPIHTADEGRDALRLGKHPNSN